MIKRRDFLQQYDEAMDIFKKNGGMMRATEAIRAGIHPRILYFMKNSGHIEMLSRGLYYLPENQPGHPDMVAIASKYSKAVICLVSALSFHELTTQIPHTVSVALPQGATTPKPGYPPVTAYRFSGAAYTEGVVTHSISDISINIYCAEKTIADCFKFRNKLGMDIVIEALKLYKSKKDFSITKLMGYAKICRVDKIMTPYLEMTV
jgi:predicted transcriptional regulator of viral defense system